MKRILLGTGAIVFVGALVAGATGAFFSDSETSKGNSFTAGAIDLKVDSTQHYDGLICTPQGVWARENAQVPSAREELIGTACGGTWALTDLGPSNQFFNFTDIKPGDNGEDTISLHIDNNPAWACADIKTTSNEENGINSPEALAGDVTSGPGQGELAQNIHVFAWLDNASTSGAVAGDNIWQAGEQALTALPVALSAIVSGTTTLPLADVTSNGGQPLPPGGTNNIGLAWCAGTMDTSVPGTITCNGAAMGNESQTDSATADITLRVTQARNQPNFMCNPLQNQ